MPLRQVNQSPTITDDPRAITNVLREYGFTINQLIPKVVLTANLPSGNAELDGTWLIEDGGAGNVNLIVYARGQRYRFDGGAPF